MEHVLAPRGGPYRNRKPREEKNKKQSLISRQRGRNGRVRDFAYTERVRSNTKHVWDRHRHGLCAGEGGMQTVAEEQTVITSVSMGIRRSGGGTLGRRLGQTEASDNPCGSMRVKSSPTARPTVRRRKAKGKKRYNRPCWS